MQSYNMEDVLHNFYKKVAINLSLIILRKTHIPLYVYTLLDEQKKTFYVKRLQKLGACLI